MQAVSYASQFQQSGQREVFQKAFGRLGMEIIVDIFKKSIPGATLEIRENRTLLLHFSQVNERDRCLENLSTVPSNSGWSLIAKKGDKLSIVLNLVPLPLLNTRHTDPLCNL